VKLVEKKQEIVSGQSIGINNFKAWYYFVMRNYLINLTVKSKREKRKLTNYKKLLDSESEENTMKEQEILLKFANIMAIQKNVKHVEIFIDFVQGASIAILSGKYNISQHNAYKIVERLRKQCIELWAVDLFNQVKIQTETLFGKKKYEAVVALILKLVAGLPDEYRDYIVKLLTR
jgi:hypothetical protein